MKAYLYQPGWSEILSAKTSTHPAEYHSQTVQNKLFPVDGFAGNSNPLKQNG